jgi:CDP-diacylglycerol---serine O-phosphatidyltransferase
MSLGSDDRRGRDGRRRRILSFRNRQVPVRALIPNMFTLLGLVAGLTAIRLAIESRFAEALALIVVAAVIDGIDGRLARMLKAQSRFGAELDSLADFVNFGVAPAIIIFTWALGSQRSFGWIVVMVYAVACGLRLARFNAAIDVEKPRWQSNYFTGMPAPAGAMTVLLPLYIDGIGIAGFEMRAWPALIMIYTLAMAFLMVSTIPTFSGKLAGEKIGRDLVPLIFMAVALCVAFLATYPYITLTILTLVYLAMIGVSIRRFAWHKEQEITEALAQESVVEPAVQVPLPEAVPAAVAADPVPKPDTRH